MSDASPRVLVRAGHVILCRARPLSPSPACRCRAIMRAIYLILKKQGMYTRKLAGSPSATSIDRHETPLLHPFARQGHHATHCSTLQRLGRMSQEQDTDTYTTPLSLTHSLIYIYQISESSSSSGARIKSAPLVVFSLSRFQGGRCV